MVLHFFDAATARGITAAITRAIAPGSYVVISAGSGDEQTGGRLAREYQADTLYNHSQAQIGAFFDGLDLIHQAWPTLGDRGPGQSRRCGPACAAGTSWPASAASPPPVNPAASPVRRRPRRARTPWPADHYRPTPEP